MSATLPLTLKTLASLKTSLLFDILLVALDEDVKCRLMVWTLVIGVCGAAVKGTLIEVERIDVRSDEENRRRRADMSIEKQAYLVDVCYCGHFCACCNGSVMRQMEEADLRPWKYFDVSRVVVVFSGLLGAELIPIDPCQSTSQLQFTSSHFHASIRRRRQNCRYGRNDID